MINKAIIEAITCHLLLVLLIREAHTANLDVKAYGAKGDGRTDDSKAFTSAWTAACGATNGSSTMVIGKGTYLVGPVKFQGPCKAQVTVQVQGTVQAPSDINQFKTGDWVAFSNINMLHVLGDGIFDGQGSVAWAKNDCNKTGKCTFPVNIRLDSLTNSTIQDITSKDSKLFHISVLGCKNVTLQNINISAPNTSLNTDGVHIGRSNGVNITGATIKTGDDCVSLGDGSQQVNIQGVTCGPGHGISVGSLGKYKNEFPVLGITVTNCTITDTVNGIRIKTWPASPAGVASNIQFTDITMNNVGTPILIDQQYCPGSQCTEKAPSRVKLSNIMFRNITGTSSTELAVKLICSKGVPCQKVDLGNIDLTFNNGTTAKSTSVCANVSPQVTGTMVPPVCTNSTA